MSVFLKFSLSTIFFCLSTLISLLSTLPITKIALAEDHALKVVINEIAWMGTEAGWQKEWIELYNPKNRTVSLKKWKINSPLTGTPQITLEGIIGANSYFLLERTSDETVSDAKADQIYVGNLSNAGETLLLIDEKGVIIDKIDCSLGWFAGNNTAKKTMERINPCDDGSDPANWKTSNEKHGTPGEENSPVTEREVKTIDIASSDEPNSRFYFLLTIGIFISACFALLLLSLWLKLKQGKGKMN